MMRQVILGVCFLYGANAMAQNEDKRELELGLDFTSELQATDKGDYNYVNLLRLNASLPVGRSLSIDAASISTCMTAAESIGGDQQTFSNLDAGNVPFALSVLGVNWQINDRHTLFVGVRNMNEDYFISPVTSFFTNSSCGIYPTIGANYPIANYPVASVGVHYKYENEDEDEGRRFVVQASLYNGTGYNHFTGRENVFRVCPKSDGVFGLAQVEYTNNGSCYFLGSSAYHNQTTSVTPWAYAEQQLCNDLSLIAGYSHAFATDAECKDFVGLGVHYQKAKHELGIFTDYANFSEANEFATELTYKYNATTHLYIQPVLNIISTSFKESETAVRAVGSLRVGLTF